jgi:PTH2 family peptidyl-tRNA hydrolase
MFQWISGGQTKVVVSVDSEKELMDIYHNILQTSDVPVSLILDAGRTEFNGVATYTCIAVGPAEVSKVDAFTGKLKLL